MQAPHGIDRSRQYEPEDLAGSIGGRPKRHRTRTAAGQQMYDSETGQVYVESTRKARRRMSPWFHESLGSARLVTNANAEGTSTLKEMAIRLLLKNLDCLELDSLRNVDWTLGQALLETINESDLMSFHVWRIFTTRYFKERPGNYERYMSDTHYELDTVIRDLTSFSDRAPFLTFLTVNDVCIPAQTYLQLGVLPNLAVLKLWETGRSDDPAGFNERIFRSWQATTVGGDSFRSLRALETTDVGLSSAAVLTYFQHCRRLSLVRILPGNGRQREKDLLGSWSKMHVTRRVRHDQHLILTGKTVRHEDLLSAALEAAKLAPSTPPHCTITYGNNEDTRYHRERPMSAEVWVRELDCGERLPPAASSGMSIPPMRSNRRTTKGSSLKEVLGSFTIA